MSCLIDVIIPGPWWNALTYGSERELPAGTRVRVPVGRGMRVGFVLGLAKEKPAISLRHIAEVLDEKRIIDPDLWDLALWMGCTFLCGAGQALQLICPAEFLRGEPTAASSLDGGRISSFTEEDFFEPWDEERTARYREMLESPGRILLLFPEAGMAKAFFSSLPNRLQAGALLWPSTGGKKLWRAWQMVRSGGVRAVLAPPGGVFAPLRPDCIIVEEEASAAYIFQRPPRVPARSLAGRRAMMLGAKLILAGRIPSSRTFLRTAPKCKTLPDRNALVFADIRRSVRGEEQGVEGALPLTISLLERTRDMLAAGRHALWILDRRGEAAEVFCLDCGRSIRCSRCGALMRSEERGRSLRCVRCSARGALPSRCPDCGGEFWSGRRPGLESLFLMAGRLIRGYPVRLCDGKTPRGGGPSLLLGTRGALSLCDALDIGLTAWLDLDAELRKPDHGVRFHVFSMIWESYWRGRRHGAEERVVLIQGRRFGLRWRDVLAGGWGRFWRDELKLRDELDLPPFGLMAQIDLPKSEDRDVFIRMLEDAGLFVMDPGDRDLPLWAGVRNVEPLFRALEPRFHIGRSRQNFPVVTIWSE